MRVSTSWRFSTFSDMEIVAENWAPQKYFRLRFLRVSSGPAHSTGLNLAERARTAKIRGKEVTEDVEPSLRHAYTASYAIGVSNVDPKRADGEKFLRSRLRPLVLIVESRAMFVTHSDGKGAHQSDTECD